MAVPETAKAKIEYSFFIANKFYGKFNKKIIHSNIRLEKKLIQFWVNKLTN
jgi:hypothetical protein